MDEMIAIVIVAGAVVFTIKHFIDMYRGKNVCKCGSGCSCTSKKTCFPEMRMVNKK